MARIQFHMSMLRAYRVERQRGLTVMFQAVLWMLAVTVSLQAVVCMLFVRVQRKPRWIIACSVQVVETPSR